MKKGSFFITLTKRLPCADFSVLEFELYKMSWGEATIFIMQKNTDPRMGGGKNAGSGDHDHSHNQSPSRRRGGGGGGHHDEDDDEY